MGNDVPLVAPHVSMLTLRWTHPETNRLSNIQKEAYRERKNLEELKKPETKRQTRTRQTC